MTINIIQDFPPRLNVLTDNNLQTLANGCIQLLSALIGNFLTANISAYTDGTTGPRIRAYTERK